MYANDCNDSNAAITPGTFICGNPQFLGAIFICSDGGYVASTCGANRVCVPQPTGVGSCQ